jgi:hypothetical protein
MEPVSSPPDRIDVDVLQPGELSRLWLFARFIPGLVILLTPFTAIVGFEIAFDRVSLVGGLILLALLTAFLLICSLIICHFAVRNNQSALPRTITIENDSLKVTTLGKTTEYSLSQCRWFIDSATWEVLGYMLPPTDAIVVWTGSKWLASRRSQDRELLLREPITQMLGQIEPYRAPTRFALRIGAACVGLLIGAIQAELVFRVSGNVSAFVPLLLLWLVFGFRFIDDIIKATAGRVEPLQRHDLTKAVVILTIAFVLVLSRAPILTAGLTAIAGTIAYTAQRLGLRFATK